MTEQVKPITDTGIAEWSTFFEGRNKSGFNCSPRVIQSFTARIYADSVIIAGLKGEVKGLRASVDYLKGEQQ